jgi:hypothetical protein
VLGPVITLAAAATSYLVFRATMRGQQVRLTWAHHQPWTVAVAAPALSPG